MPEVNIPVTKGKATVAIDTDKLPDHVYAAALALGLKEMVNRGMSKITVAKLEGDDLAKAQAAAMAKAEENVAAINAGTIKLASVKAAKGTSGAVMTEAKRLARNVIKDEMKRRGVRVSYVDAKDITTAAVAYLETDDGKVLLDAAKANVEARSTAVTAGVKVDVTTIPINAKKKADAEAKLAKEKADKLVAKGVVAGIGKKSKPQATAHH